MKQLLLGILLLLLPPSGRSASLGPYVQIGETGYSVSLPKGWSTMQMKASLVANADPARGLVMGFLVRAGTIAQGVTDLKSLLQEDVWAEDLKHAAGKGKVLEEVPFETTSRTKGVRLLVEQSGKRRLNYCIPGREGETLSIFAKLGGDEAAKLKQYEEIIRTLRF